LTRARKISRSNSAKTANISTNARPSSGGEIEGFSERHKTDDECVEFLQRADQESKAFGF